MKKTIINQKEFLNILGNTFAYKVSGADIAVFKKCSFLKDVSNPCQGLITGDVARFVRKWFECSMYNLNLNSRKSDTNRFGKWFPYSNGGEFKKWYGNNEDVVNWENNGQEILNFFDEKGKLRSRPQNQKYYFQEGGTWTAISSGMFSVRYYPDGQLFSNAGMAIFADRDLLIFLIGFLNSKLSQHYLGIYNEGLNYNQGDISRLPIIFSNKDLVKKIVDSLITQAKEDWDSFEVSWDFKGHPLV